MIKKISIISLLLSFQSTELLAGAHRVDAHAPIGVMRDHVHEKGELMTSYRFENMAMQDMATQDNKMTSREVLDRGYMATPTKMQMKMHMVGAMYGVTDKLSVMAMGSFMQKDMDHKNMALSKFNRTSEGFGDLQLSSLYQFLKTDSRQAQLNTGISLPTGDINEKHNGTRLPYPMQIGSGSYEFLPGISYSGFTTNYSYGAQVNSTLRLNQNNVGYKLGDIYNVTSWVSRKVNSNFSVSTRLNYTKNEGIEGVDDTLTPTMVPTANSYLQARENLDLLLGFNLISHQYLKGHRLAFEVGAPLYQRIDGPMLQNNYKFTIGWQKTF